MKTPILDQLSGEGNEFLGTRHPIICGGMTWVSDPKLVAAVSEAGGFAVLAGGNAPVEIVEQQVKETRRLTDRPFALNLITLAPAYHQHLELVERLKLSHVVFAGSFPRRREVEKAKAAGSKVLCFASTESIAERMMGYGADALVLEGMEAGGHVGHVTLAILLQQILFKRPEIPVFVGGGVGNGQMVAHLLLMGAAGVQLGTRFAIAEESQAHPAFKEAFIKAKARDAVSTPQFDSRLPVVAVRALRNRGTDDFGRLQVELIGRMDRGELSRGEAQMKVEEFWVGRLREAVMDGKVELGSLMAGQSVGLVDRVMTVREIIDELVAGAEAELRRVKETLACAED